MAKPARRKHIDQLAGTLENITDAIAAVRLGVERNQESEAARLRNTPSLREDFVRIEGLLGGVRTALERMGGTTLPAFREDIQALRAEMAGYARAHAQTITFIEELHAKLNLDDQPAPKPKRRGRRDKAALDEIQNLGLMDQWRSELDEDVAEAEAKAKRRLGRPKKVKPLEEDTSQKLIDEPEQEVAEG